MVTPDDPKAERLKQRKGKRNMTRATFGGVFKLLIHGTTPPPDPISEDCEKCLALTARRNAGLSFMPE